MGFKAQKINSERHLDPLTQKAQERKNAILEIELIYVKDYISNFSIS